MTLRLAVDAMGGDKGPSMVIAGAHKVVMDTPTRDIHFTFYGDLPTIQTELSRYPQLAARSTVVHADKIITSDLKPSLAVRSGRHSNLGMAIDSVAQGVNHGVVSAGNTGAYMALSKIILKTLPGIDRPAIPATLPSVRGQSVVLDLGANVDCPPAQLVQFAIMGEALAHILLGAPNPSIGLLNIGAEELKGSATVQEAATLIRNIAGLNFKGFVEGDDIAAGTTDVIVTDGFTGNVALKSIEGTARLMRHFLTQAFTQNMLTRLLYLLVSPVMGTLKKRIDPRVYNGAVFLGLKHVAVKSHGGTDFVGFAHAIDVAIRMIEQNLPYKIEQRLVQSGVAVLEGAPA
jgi:glycerol-3-phosphate acyltransferase PlsX